MTRTLLTRLEELCNVDVDDADYIFLKTLPLRPHNQTSNQRVIALTLDAPHNRPMLLDCVQKHGHEGWEAVLNRMSVLICVNNLPLITGRVLLQTSPRHLDDYNAILKHVHEYAALFEEYGVPRDRYAIKIPFSGAGAAAAATLNSEGIPTLATSVFCLEQAIAASQAKCPLISPYFNEIAARFDESLRPKVKDPALEHPMSPRVLQMLESFAKRYQLTKEEQPVMVIASHFNPEEILAMAELGCHHVTISQPNLLTLMGIPDDLPAVTTTKPAHPYAQWATAERLKGLSSIDPLAKADPKDIDCLSEVDYIANKGSALDAAINEDSVSRKRITDAVAMFIEFENKGRAIIEDEMAKI